MQYWILTTEYPPFHGGGISTYCFHTARMLSDQGCKVTVIVNDTVNEIHSESKNIRIIRFIPNQTSLGKYLGYEARLAFEFAHQVEKLMESEGIPEILETQDYGAIGYYVFLKKHLGYKNFDRLKTLITLHAPNFLYLDFNQVPQYKLPIYFNGEMEKAAMKMADIVISPSQYLLSAIEYKINWKFIKPLVVFNPFLPGEPLMGNYIKGDIIFFGKLTPQKGCIEMMNYFDKLWKQGEQYKLTIIGGGQHYFYPLQKDMLSHFQQKYGHYVKAGLLQFEGNLLPEKAIERLKRCNVVITPSIVDNLPYTVIEAMSLGKIVLSSNCGGQRELIDHGQNGFLFEHRFEDFADQLKFILNLSELEIDTIGKRAVDTIQQLNYDNIYKLKLDVIKSSENQRHSFFPFITEIPSENEEQLSEADDLLSVVIPYYNMGAFVEDCILSVLDSKYAKIEIIVVDDGSEKEQHQIIRGLQKKYQFKLICIENGGLSNARNVGALEASGGYMAFLDPDDTVTPDYYSKAIKVLGKYKNIGFVGCWAQYFGENNDVWPAFNPEPPYLLAHNMINSSALVYKKWSFLKYGLNDPEMLYGMEDYDSVIGMVKNGIRGVALPETLWNYRIRKNSMQQSFNSNKELYLYRKIANKHKSFFDNYGAELSNLLNHNGPGYKLGNPTWSMESNTPGKLKNSALGRLIKKNKTMRKLALSAYHLLYRKN